MGRTPCCDKTGLKKGPWGPEEDEILVQYINKNGHGSWRNLPKLAGLLRCGKSCRLRWTNYLRPDIKRGPFSSEEEKLVIQLHGILGNRWAAIACQLPGRTDNEIKNLWNTHLKKRLLHMGIDPQTHESATTILGLKKPLPASPSTRHMAQWESARLEAEARLSKESLFLTTTKSEYTTSDHFLHLWNSEIGDSFRNIEKGNKTACPSPISQASSSTKCRSFSGTTMETETPLTNDGLVYKCDSASSSSNEMEDSSDMALQLLLDFTSGNDMSFLEQSDDFGYCHMISTESYSNCSQ